MFTFKTGGSLDSSNFINRSNSIHSEEEKAAEINLIVGQQSIYELQPSPEIDISMASLNQKLLTFNEKLEIPHIRHLLNPELSEEEDNNNFLLRLAENNHY